MKLRKRNRYFIILAFCSMLLLAYSTNAYAKSASNQLKASATVHINSKKTKKKSSYNNLSYYKNKKSKGLNMYAEGMILKQLGCTYGYNLDGGGSITMVFKGRIVTKNWTGDGRPCYDMIYVGK